MHLNKQSGFFIHKQICRPMHKDIKLYDMGPDVEESVHTSETWQNS